MLPNVLQRNGQALQQIQPQMLLVPRLRNAGVDTGLQRWCQLLQLASGLS